MTLPNYEAKRFSAVIAGIELAAILLEGAAVVHVDLVAGDRLTFARNGERDFSFEVLAAHLEEFNQGVCRERTSLLMMSAKAAAANVRMVATFIFC